MEQVSIVPQGTSVDARVKENGNFQYWERDNERADFRIYWNILRRRKWLIIVPLLIVPTLVGFYLLLQKPTYEATVTLLMDSGSSKVVNIDDILQPDRSREYYETQLNILRSPIIAERVIDTLQKQKETLISQEQSSSTQFTFLTKIGKFPETILQTIKENLIGRTYSMAIDPEELNNHQRVKEFQKSTKVEPVTGTRLVNIFVSGSDPYEAAAQANTLADVYLELNFEKKLEASRKASAWLSKEIPELKEKLQTAELALQSFLEKRGLIPSDLEDKQNSVPEGSRESNAAYAATQARSIELQSQLSEMKKLLQQSPEKLQSMLTTLNSPALVTLQQKYVALENELTSLSQLFKEKHPRIVTLHIQMEQVKKSMDIEIQRYIDKINTEYNLIITKEKRFESAINHRRVQDLKIEKYIAEYKELKRDIETKRILYENLSKRLGETELTKGLQTNDVTILKRAENPIEAVSSKKTMKLLISIVVTLCFGLGSAFVAETVEKRFHSIDEAERYLQMHNLGIIPNYRDENGITIYDTGFPQNMHSSVSDFYKNLRENIKILYRKRNNISLLVTSAIPGEGKSATASNLGITFAQSGRKVLLVDIDLRKPSIHKYFHLENKPGLTDILINGYTWERLIQSTPIEGLKILTSGPIPHNPSELLDTQRMWKLHKNIKDAFDIVIYDAPTVLSIPDTIVVAAEMDGVLLVHHPTLGNKESAAAATQKLRRAGANVLGVIFNNVDLRYLSLVSHNNNSYYKNEHIVGPDDKKVGENNNYSLVSEIEISLLPATHYKSPHYDGFSFTICNISFKDEIASVRADQELSFLIIELELNNESDILHIFDTDSAVLYIKKSNTYGSALSKIYAYTDEKEAKETLNFYRCDAVTSVMENGFWGRVMVSSMSKRRGVVIYKIRKNLGSYIFCYENEEVKLI